MSLSIAPPAQPQLFVVLRHAPGDYRGAVVLENGVAVNELEARNIALEMKAKSPTQEFSVAGVMLIAKPTRVPFEMLPIKE